MGRKPKPQEERTVQLGVRLSAEEIADIDEEIARLFKTSRVKVTRSAVIRAWIDEARERRRKK